MIERSEVKWSDVAEIIKKILHASNNKGINR